MTTIMLDPQTIDIISKLGVVGVCLFVIYLGYQREQRSAKAFEDLNQRSHEAQMQTVKALTTLTEKIENLPCQLPGAMWDGQHDRRDPHRR